MRWTADEVPIHGTARYRVRRKVDACFGLALLFMATFRISTALDRVGLRLEGPRFLSRPADRRISMPMDALQITADGTPIVLGPDHPTTNDYPVIACAVTADLGNLAARRPGTAVRFVRA